MKPTEALPEGGTGRLTELPLHALLADVASGHLAPGGMGMTAVMGAVAASLASLVAKLTAGKPGYEPMTEEMERLAERARVLEEQLLTGLDQELAAFNKLVEAMGLPGEGAGPGEMRRACIQIAAKGYAQVPLQLGALASEVVGLGASAVRYGNRQVVADGGTGWLAALAAWKAASLHVLVNLNGAPSHEPWVIEARQKALRWLEEAAIAEAELWPTLLAAVGTLKGLPPRFKPSGRTCLGRLGRPQSIGLQPWRPSVLGEAAEIARRDVVQKVAEGLVFHCLLLRSDGDGVGQQHLAGHHHRHLQAQSQGDRVRGTGVDAHHLAVFAGQFDLGKEGLILHGRDGHLAHLGAQLGHHRNQQVVGHGPGCLDPFQAQENGLGLRLANPNQQGAAILQITQHHHRVLRRGVQNHPGDLQLHQQGSPLGPIALPRG